MQSHIQYWYVEIQCITKIFLMQEKHPRSNKLLNYDSVSTHFLHLFYTIKLLKLHIIKQNNIENDK